MSSWIGKQLSGRYKIIESIGRGGMAEVYKVWDSQRATFHALKMLRADLAQDRIFLRRFQREAITLQKLQHPNIVRFYGIEKDDIYVYMLMSYIEGGTLQTMLFRNDDRPLHYVFVQYVMQSLCSALYYAHSQGLVHCDIKPGNVMIDKHGEILLTDFGIARMTDAATSTMIGFGTPAYMAPELVQGRDPTPQSDFYSMGILLYEMVTGGERPFIGENEKSTGSTSEKVRWEQVHLQPPSPKLYNPEIPTELEAVILKCLNKEPDQRHKDAMALLDDFEHSLDKAEYDRNIPISSFAPTIESQAESVRDEQGFESPAEEISKNPNRLQNDQPKQRLIKAGWILPIVIIGLILLGIFFLFDKYIKPSTPTPDPPTVYKENVDAAGASVADELTVEESAKEEAVEDVVEEEPVTDEPEPTITLTLEPTNTQVPPTKTISPTNTPPPPKPYLVADKNYFCRQSPSSLSEDHWVLTQGDSSKILGRSSNGWWLISINDSRTRTKCCWVAGGVVNGDLAIVPTINYEIDRMNCPAFP